MTIHLLHGKAYNSLTILKHTPGKSKEIMEYFKKEAASEGDIVKGVNVCSRV